jgi:hypothetical protein
MATVPDPSTPGQIAEIYEAERRQTYRQTDQDGPLIAFIKWVYGRAIWHGLIEWYIRSWLTRWNLYSVLMAKDNAKVTFNKAVEYYWLWWTFGLLVAYAFTYLIAQDGPAASMNACSAALRGIAVGVLGLGCLFRIVEIMAVSFRLHVLKRYWTRMPAHALTLTFLAYFHEVVCFSVLYLTEGFFTGDKFNTDQPIWSGALNAAYLSTVTIATIGYGDFVPLHWSGKLLVIFQVFVGLILLVVAIGRVLSATSASPSADPATTGEVKGQMPD